jgi:hypothetical protein
MILLFHHVIFIGSEGFWDGLHYESERRKKCFPDRGSFGVAGPRVAAFSPRFPVELSCFSRFILSNIIISEFYRSLHRI